MSKSDADVIEAVTLRIDRALKANRQHETTLVVLLVALFVTGLTLIVYGAVTGQWLVLAGGGLLKIAILYPLRLLIKLREGNVALQILPQLLRLAKTPEMKALAAKLIERLIEQV